MSSMSKPVWDVPPETDDGTLYRYECYQQCAVHLLYVAFRFCHGFSIFHVQWLSPAWYQQNGSGFTVQIERHFGPVATNVEVHASWTQWPAPTSKNLTSQKMISYDFLSTFIRGIYFTGKPDAWLKALAEFNIRAVSAPLWSSPRKNENLSQAPEE